MTLNFEHRSIFVEEILKMVKPKKGSLIIDATLGDGGHSLTFLEKGATVIGIDQDSEAIERSSKRLAKFKNFTAVKSNFSNLSQVVADLKLKPVDAILFDLGVSTLQLLEPSRGFSFRETGPLDMRMDQQFRATAADLVNGLSEKELTRLFETLGDEPRARVYTKRIVAARQRAPFTTTKQLADLIAHNAPRGRVHPATKVFQALRMAVNLEREAISEALPQAVSILKEGGLLCVISFHSGEDRLIKHFMQTSNLKIITPKPLVPSESEIKNNPRSRSAKLRIAQKQ